MRYAVCYDIVDNKTRRAVVRILFEYAYRVQKSVFEGIFSKESLIDMQKKLADVINPDLDSVRIYPLCDTCSGKINIQGQGNTIENLGYIII